MTLAQVTSENI